MANESKGQPQEIPGSDDEQPLLSGHNSRQEDRFQEAQQRRRGRGHRTETQEDKGGQEVEHRKRNGRRATLYRRAFGKYNFFCFIFISSFLIFSIVVASIDAFLESKKYDLIFTFSYFSA